MTPGYYGERWFHLNRSTAGTRGASRTSYTDIKPFILIGMSVPGMNDLTASIPLKDQILALGTAQRRRRSIRAARKAFASSKRNHSTSLKFEYARMLEMTGNKLELDAFINQLTRTEPNNEKVVSFISEINERKGLWLKVYEKLKDYDISNRSSLSTALRLARAQINLRLFLAAHNTAAKTVQSFPESSLAADMLATTEMLLDRPEAALTALRAPRARNDPALRAPEIRALFMSGRAASAVAACKRNLIPVPAKYSTYTDIRVVVPAESALLWHRVSLPSIESFTDYTSRVLVDTEKGSEFFNQLYPSWLLAFNSKATPSTTDITKWTDIGRNNGERATALNLLTLLLCRFSKLDAALEAAEKAARFMPDSPILWYPVISLSRGRPTVLAEAASHCPHDDDIWLAQLVAAIDPALNPTDSSKGDVQLLIDQALSSRNISPAALTRGGAYLFRMGAYEPAQRLAAAASTKDPSFLPAQLAALRCAMQSNDRKLALIATRQAIQASLKPDIALFQKYVALHSEEPNPEDPYLLNALQVLRKYNPDDPRWLPMLAYIRFLRGGWQNIDAFYEFSKAMDMGITNKSTTFFAAEASRRMGNPGRAAQILRDMLLNDPDDIEVLNNLAYTLASVQENPIAKNTAGTTALEDIPDDSSFITRSDALDEALRIIPKLLRLAPSELSVLDTATFVLIEAGKIKDAEHALSLLAEKAKDEPEYAFKAAIHQARLQMIAGDSAAAEKTIRTSIRSSKGISDEDVMRANTLLAEVMTIQEVNRRKFLDVLRSKPLE
jgi:tetratricopeptide (TPR) repeat protein